MKPETETSIEIRATLNRLKWHLIGLRLTGVRDWPMSPRHEETCGSGESEKDPVHGQAEQLLVDIGEDLGECTRCRLHLSRTKIVYGEGSPRARLVFVGEGPGFDEDQQGRPFVGRAGKLLDNMIKALGCRREEVYICNVVKCRPPGNRTPLPDEIQTCCPFLFRQLEAIAPEVICALGASAAQTLLATTKAISGLRGQRHLWGGIPLICTYHPAYLLRNPSQKASTWQDLLVVQGILKDR
jgi:uracil-DNA glycosylase